LIASVESSTGAYLRLDDSVAAGHDGEDTTLLDDGGLLETVGVDAMEEVVVELHVVERLDDGEGGIGLDIDVVVDGGGLGRLGLLLLGGGSGGSGRGGGGSSGLGGGGGRGGGGSCAGSELGDRLGRHTVSPASGAATKRVEQRGAGRQGRKLEEREAEAKERQKE